MMIEITNATEQEINRNYPANLTYRGEEFFETIYMDRLMKKADAIITVDNQESYLGYLPREDVFVEGYDTWQEEGHTTPNIVFLQIKGDSIRDVTRKMCDKYDVEKLYHPMMYGKDGMYNHLTKQIPNLVDIRLD